MKDAPCVENSSHPQSESGVFLISATMARIRQPEAASSVPRTCAAERNPLPHDVRFDPHQPQRHFVAGFSPRKGPGRRPVPHARDVPLVDVDADVIRAEIAQRSRKLPGHG